MQTSTAAAPSSPSSSQSPCSSATSCNDDRTDAGTEPDPVSDSTSTASTTTATEPEDADDTANTEALDLLFQRAGTRRPHIAWVALDGSGESAPLTDFGDGAQTNPDWSPDGNALVFVDDRRRDRRPVRRRRRGDRGHQAPRLRLALPLPRRPGLVPDGEQDRLQPHRRPRRGRRSSTLESVEVATGEVHLLLGPWTEQFTAGARWSPDGRRIVFELVSKDRARARRRHLRRHAGRRASRPDPRQHRSSTTDPAQLAKKGLTDPRLFAATADWSPDGRWIVYSALATPARTRPPTCS